MDNPRIVIIHMASIGSGAYQSAVLPIWSKPGTSLIPKRSDSKVLVHSIYDPLMTDALRRLRMEDIANLRKQIDKVNLQILELLAERGNLAQKIGEIM